MNDLEKLCKIFIDANVLYVEDEEEVQEISLTFFNKFFGNIDIASNGKDGLELFKKNVYDIVITDLKMPKMDGREMLENIKKLNKDVVTIVTTATDSNIELSKTLCDVYLKKPIEFMVFIEALKSLEDKYSKIKYST